MLHLARGGHDADPREASSRSDAKAPSSTPTSWAPLRHPVFRALWIATAVSNVGTWMHDMGAAWLMTALTPNPLMVALVQAAASLPVFLLSMPAGVFADIFDRRRFLLAAQIWLLGAALVLGVLSLLGLVTPAVLLVATFALGIGSAMNGPPLTAVVAELVPRSEIPAAVALNSLGFNLARAIGPALGGVAMFLASPSAVFFLNALSVGGVAWVVWRWDRPTDAGGLPSEHFLPALRSGLRYVRYAPLLRVTLLRIVAFLLPASAHWALLPIIARQQLGLTAFGYGMLLACVGVGAVAGALLLPRVHRAGLGADSILLAATIVFSSVSLVIALDCGILTTGAALIPAGSAWMAAISTLNAAAQVTSAGWVKARALAVYLVAFAGAMTVGSVVWGQAAIWFGASAALGASGVAGILIGLSVMLRWSLRTLPCLDLAPVPFSNMDQVADETEHDRGPVLITVEYLIDTADEVGFVAAARQLRRVRLRAGALTWGVYEDRIGSGRWVEAYLTTSWLDHLRHEERLTRNDEDVLERALAFHRGSDQVQVTHLIAPLPTVVRSR